MSNKKDHKEMVKMIMEKYPVTRDSDFKLYGFVCLLLCPETLDMSFRYVLWNHAKLGMPSYESVTRARRKMQELYPHLRGKNYKARQERSLEYHNEYGHGG